MLFTYPAFFHKEDSSYWVEFPDLEGCQTFADTLNEAVKDSQEALSAYILTVLENGAKLPTPSDILQLKAGNDSFTSLVTCELTDLASTKAVKKTLTIPSWLNERALALNINFSKVLQDALLDKVQK